MLALLTRRLSRTKPKLYAQALNVLHLLATTPISSVPILEYLSPRWATHPSRVGRSACFCHTIHIY